MTPTTGPVTFSADAMPFLKRTLVPAVLVLTAVFAPRAAAQQPGGAPTDVSAHRRAFLAEVMQNVERTVQQWRAAREGRDAKALAALYTSDAVLFPYRGKPATGKDAVEATLPATLPQAVQFRATMRDFTAGGGLAYYSGEFQYLVRPTAGDPFTVAGSYILVLERANNGWRIRSHIERADLDLLAAQGQIAFPNQGTEGTPAEAADTTAAGQLQ